MKRLPLAVQNAYSDLLERLQEDTVLEIGRQPVLRSINPRTYWYARLYIGDQARERYLGPDTPALRAHLERLKEEQEGLREREKQRRSLVQMLQVQGVPRIAAATGMVLQALARAGAFRSRAVLVWHACLSALPADLGTVIPEVHHASEDVAVAQFHEIRIGLDDRVTDA